MKLKLFATFFCVFLGFAALAQSKLEKKRSAIIVTYGYVGCPCAPWAIHNRYYNTPHREYIFLEPANNKITDADGLPNGSNIVTVKLSGYFYREKGYPKNFHAAKGDPKPAR